MKQTIINSYRKPEGHRFDKKDWIRSSDRTKLLHEGIISHIKSIIPNFDNNYIAEIEQPVKDNMLNRSGVMKIDIVIFDSELNKVLLIPVKHFLCNASQNMGNYANGYIAETTRIREGGTECSIAFLTIFSNNTPYFKDGGQFKKWDTGFYIDLNPFAEHLGGCVSFEKITYEITCGVTTKPELYNNIENCLTNIITNDFDQKIRSILH